MNTRNVLFVFVVVFALGLFSSLEKVSAQEITTLIVNAPSTKDIQVQLVPTDKDTLSAEANGDEIPIDIDGASATATINLQEKTQGKGKRATRSPKSKGHKNDGSNNDNSDSAGFRATPLMVTFVAVLVSFGFAATAFSQQRSQKTSLTTLLVTLGVIGCVLVACMTTTSDGEVDATIKVTIFIPTYLILLDDHEYFVGYLVLADGNIIFYFIRAARPLALVAATSTSRLQSVAAGLTSTGFEVTTFDATTTTPSSSDLRSFTYVLVFSDPTHTFADKNALGDNLARAFDSGVKVVTATFANVAESPIGGKFGDVSNGYILLDPSFSTTSTSAFLGAALEEDVYLITGVNTFSATMAYGTSSAAIANKGRAGLSWSDGRPLVVVGEVNNRRRTDLNFFPVANSTTDSGLWTGDGWTLLRNAIAYNS